MSNTDPSSDAKSAGLGASPTRIGNDDLRLEAKRALIWVGVIALAVLAIYLAEALLVLFGAMVFATLIDGGARLLARVAPVPRIMRVLTVLIIAGGFFAWLVIFAGNQISQEAAQLPGIVNRQLIVVAQWLQAQGLSIAMVDLQTIAGSVSSGVGTVTKAIGGILGGFATALLIVIIGLYIALEPRLYERGIAWMLPASQRREFYGTVSVMASTMRRLMAGRLVGMVFEGIITWALLACYGVPMAVLLGIVTGLLAFVPNLGALIAGSLMVLVGFSGGTDMGLYTIFVYFLVQTFDGYVTIPLIARKTVDLAPALVLSAQFVMGIVFGIMGLFLADPLLAMIKIALQRRAENIDAVQNHQTETGFGS